MIPSYKSKADRHFLYDPAVIADVDAVLFEPDEWRRCGIVLGEAIGRGSTYFVSDGTHDYALRHYRRGGVLAKLVSDHYLWFGLSRTRPWREWTLLSWMCERGLPVPRPVAAQVIREEWRYRADLLTLMLPQCTPLAGCLRDKALSDGQWAKIGRCIRRFHEAGIFHADLNAHNVLLDEQGEVYLIDFDRGCRLPEADNWKEANLSRLLRSLYKVTKEAKEAAFSEQDWQGFLEGYRVLCKTHAG